MMAMGHVYVRATLKGKRSTRVRFLVDTAATQSLIPPAIAKKAGIVASAVKDRVRLATGRVVRIPTGAGLVKIDGREGAALFWIGPCDEPLLGAETLETLGLAVDPVRRRLRATRPYASRLGGMRRG
jgi:clan AA aspartic protease